MAFKFLSRPEAKQRVLRIDLAKTISPAKDKKGAERAILVTAESDRLTYFWNDKSGDWSFHTRPHSPLGVLAVAPESTLGVPWSRRNGVAADGDLAAVAYKRELDKGGPAGLFLDVLAWSAADARWNFLTEENPIAIPLAPPCVGVGIDVWAWLTGFDLSIVVQTWAGKSGPEGPVPPDLDHLPGFGFGGLPLSPPTPRLTLIQTTIDPGDLSVLAEQDAWKLTDLDEGGFDLDARFDKEQIWVVHRRNAASMSFPFEPTGNSAGVWMLDEAGLGNDPIDLLESQLVADMPPTVLVSCDPSSAKAKVEADDLPSVEHPQLQRIDPLIVTGDRLRFVEISANREDKQWRLRPRVQRADKVAIWRGAADWRMERIGPVEHAFWPLNLGVLAPCQWMVDVRDGRIAFATMLSLKPVYLWRYEVTSKGIEMTFGREDRLIGGIACHRFLATPDLLTGEFEWTGMSVLDIGHERIVLDAAGESAFPAENTQFNGLMSGSTAREAGGTLEYFFPTVNTLGGLLVAHQDAGHGLCGYVGMGDGGGRVIFDSKVDPIEPTTTDTFKSLPPEIVTGPGGAGRAWITLQAADFVAGQLPGYPVPYSDVMRTLAPPQNGLEFTLVFLPAERLLLHFTPRSLGGGLQPLIDVLPIADALGNPEANASLDDLAPPAFDLVEDQADAIQISLGASLPASDLIGSDDAQPFPVQFTISPRVIQAGSPIIFRAQLSDPAVTASAFTWTFTSPLPMVPPGDLSGAEATLTFPFAGQWSVRLRVDAADGRRTEITQDLDVTPSLWSTVWSVYRELNMEGLRLGTTTLELMRHRIEFRIGADGTRQSVHVDYLPEHGSAFRFDAGTEAQQGRTTLRLPVIVSSVDGSFTGLVGAAVKLRRADVRLNVERPFTLGVVTSDRRSLDVLRREAYADLDSTEDREVTPEEADVETIRKFFFSPGRAADMTPNALAAKPVGEPTVSLDDVRVQVELTPLASVISFLIGFVIALNLIALVAGPLLAVLLVVLGPAAIVAIGVGSLAALVALAISAGLGWLFIQLAQAAVNWVANDIARDQLSSQETLATIGEALDEAGVMNYAGEGLAEAIAIKAIKTAMADGHGVEPPTHEQPDPNNAGSMRAPSGRERFRPQFFETVVVGPGACRILLRVP